MLNCFNLKMFSHLIIYSILVIYLKFLRLDDYEYYILYYFKKFYTTHTHTIHTHAARLCHEM